MDDYVYFRGTKTLFSIIRNQLSRVHRNIFLEMEITFLFLTTDFKQWF